MANENSKEHEKQSKWKLAAEDERQSLLGREGAHRFDGGGDEVVISNSYALGKKETVSASGN